MAIKEDFFALFLKFFALGIFFTWIYNVLCIRSGRKITNNCYSTMSDGILDGIFSHSSQNFSV